MDWNDNEGTVSRAFDDWKLVHQDIRAFMRLGLRFSTEAYDAIWERISHEPAEDDSSDIPELFHREVEGLWQNDFKWMLLAAVVKDAVSAFEVYLERGADEVLEHHGLAFVRRNPESALYWRELVAFYNDYLGILIETDEVKPIRNLRHFLTHKRGELRTDALREKFQTPEDEWALNATLRDSDVERHLDTLAGEVRRIDPKVYQFSWGGDRVEALLQGRSK